MSELFLEAEDLSYVWKSKELFSREKDKTLWTIPRLEISNAGIILLAGRNGSGKSTLLRCLLGLTRPTAGTVKWFGSPSIPRGSIGYLPELPVLPARVSVGEIITSLLGVTMSEFQERERNVDQYKSLNISNLAERPAQLLSKGQQQKLLLAFAVSGSPKGFVLDEPFSGLDPWARTELSEFLINLGNAGHFLLVSSHDAPVNLRKHIRETWIIENSTLHSVAGCAIPE
jgi:ABC-type multidrug transport system ATPase subunit